MIKEAIQHVLELGKASVAPSLTKLNGDPADVHYLMRPDGSYEILRNAPHRRAITINSIEDFIRIVRDCVGVKTGDAGPQPAPFINSGGAVYVTTAGVRYVPEQGNPRDEVFMPFTFSDEYRFMEERKKSPVIMPADLRAALRYVLRDCGFAQKLVDQVSKIDFNVAGSNSVNLDRKGESMGNSIQRAVGDPVGLPDEMQLFDVRMWSNMDLQHRLKIDVMIDPDHNARAWRFQVLNLNEFIHENTRIVFERMVAGLKDANVAVYRGCFSQKQPG